MNRMSLFFAALLAASLVVEPGHPPETPDGTQRPAGSAATRSSTATRTDKSSCPDQSLLDQAKGMLTSFLQASKPSGADVAGYSLLFATVADPVQTHLAGAFDHDVAALQDGVQDSGYLFDSSWIPWELPRTYDAYQDELDADRARREKGKYPGILLFRKTDHPPSGKDPYARGLIVFLLAEKPTAGVNVTQLQSALAILKAIADKRAVGDKSVIKSAAKSANKPTAPLTLPEPIRIAGPTFSGSFDSLVPLVRAFTRTDGIQAPKNILIRSSGFTSCVAAAAIAQSISTQFSVHVDIGSANHPFESWKELALRTLENSGTKRTNVAVLSEGESLFGEQTPSDQSKTGDGNRSGSVDPCEGTQPAVSDQPLYLQFPRDISALRSYYEKQGLLDAPANPEAARRSLRLNAEDARNGDSIRMYGADETVAEQEAVLFGISEFIRSHGIHAAVIVATSEEDSLFLTRFLHSNNAGVRVVVMGATRLFMRGSTTQFRGDMMVSSFPLLPRLHDWTGIADPRGDPEYHVFPNDSSGGMFLAVRDLLWGNPSSRLPREYSRPDWHQGDQVDLRPPVYIVALGGGAAWPVSVLEEAPGAEVLAPQPDATNLCLGSVNSLAWRLQMPFRFGDHLHPRSMQDPTRTKADYGEIKAGNFWTLSFWICIAVPLSYCVGVWYADPIRRRWFAYLQPAASWQQWILLVSVPCLLSQATFLILAHQVTFPAIIPGNNHGWLRAALGASVLMPALILAISAYKADKTGCFTPAVSPPDWQPAIEPAVQTTPSRRVFVVTAFAVAVVFLVFLILSDANPSLSEVLAIYREMHWDSGLSLVPTILLLILAISLWNYGALVGISVLHTRPRLPDIPDDGRISEKAGDRIANIGRPFPAGFGSSMYWVAVSTMAVGTAAALCLWPSYRAISSLSARWVTVAVLMLAAVPALLMLIDIVQFGILWVELRGLLSVLNFQPFRRGFIPLRNFSWSSIWSFSAGSLDEKRKLLAAQFECAFQLFGKGAGVVTSEDEKYFRQLRAIYASDDVRRELGPYRLDLDALHKRLAAIGSQIALRYRDKAQTLLPNFTRAVSGAAQDDPFLDEKRELEQLPDWLLLYERFLCLLYLAFICVIIARLRTLAISIVLLFSLLALAMAIYPFQPSQPLFIAGAAALLAIAIVMYAVFSQMDKDPVLARILESNPNKLEWSFYGKLIDTLALPLLTLLSSLLPGGAGRLIDLLRTAFSHVQ